MAIAGRVAMIPKGDYDATVTYQILDVVRYNDASYVAKKSSTGILPTDTEYWMLMTQDGLLVDDAFSETSTNPVQNKVVNEAIQNILNGTTSAGDSEKLGGKRAGEYALQNAVDNIQSTSRATLSQAGWYRVAEYVSTISSAYGTQGNSCTLIIKKASNTTSTDYYKIALESRQTYQRFIVQEAFTGGHTFTKIRYVYSGTTAYIEVYYNESTSNNCTFIVSDGNDFYFNWKAITPTLTSETVDGVIVTTTYDIPANVKPATTADLEDYFPLTGGEVGQVICKTSGGTTPLKVYRTDTDTPFIEFLGESGSLGHLGYNGVDNPVIRLASGYLKEILHSGNYTDYTVYKGTSAPSSTTCIWVDTANKVIKAYIDGAWTQVS